ncbi:MAG: hypothetical protein Q7R68_10975 [Nitrospirales bacterium]|nr:hypothetical protein [Nitrospirales bacterium]
MIDTVTRWLEAFGDKRHQTALNKTLGAIADRLSCQMTGTAGLVIKAGGSALAMSSATVAAHGIVQGVPVTIATSTDMPALVGTITAGSYNIFAFFIDRASTLTVAMGTEGTTLALVTFPPIPEGKALVGYITVTYASTFTGGTTPLDTATTKYISVVGAFDPSILP